MGGHDNGLEVTTFVSQIIINNFSSIDIITRDNIQKILFDINKEITNKFINSGCTIGGIIISDKILHYFWIGDVRLFISIDNQIVLISKEHNLLNLLKEANIRIKSDELDRLRNTVTQALGIKEQELSPEIGSIEINGDLKFIICSDGVSNVEANQYPLKHFNCMQPDEIQSTIQSNCQIYSKDNYSAIIGFSV